MRALAVFVLFAACAKADLSPSQAEALLRAELATKTTALSIERATCSTDCSDGECADYRKLAGANLITLGPCEVADGKGHLTATPTAAGRELIAPCHEPTCFGLITSRVEMVSIDWPGKKDDHRIEVPFSSQWAPTEAGRALGQVAAAADLTKAGFWHDGDAWRLTLLPAAEHGSHPAW